MAVDPGAHLGQLLPLCRSKQGLLLLHAVELLQVLPQHLVSTPKTEKASERRASLPPPVLTHVTCGLMTHSDCLPHSRGKPLLLGGKL